MDIKRILGICVIVLLVITAFGCRKKEPLSPEALAKPAVAVKEKTMAVPTDVLDWGKSTLKLVDEIKCDTQGGKGLFSFKLSNPTDKTYVLRNVGALETGVNPIKMKVNSRLFDYKYCRDGANVATLAPGSSIICTREFAPTETTTGDFIIKTGVTKLGAPAENRLFIISNDFTTEIVFKCD